MRPVPILLTHANGDVQSGNEAAVAVLGSCTPSRCSELVRAEDAHGQRVCTPSCPSSFEPGEQRDHGVVKVRGLGFRLICSALEGAHVVALIPSAAPTNTPDLTDREKQVLELVSRGLTSHRIARRLGVTTSTVRTHVEHIRDKLGVRTRSQAVARGLALGQIE